MEYTISITQNGGQIEELPEIYLHFAHHDFDIVWNPATKRQDVVRGINVFFGGMGEGSKFDNWQDAIHSTLYDLFQYDEHFHDGDAFVVKYNRSTAKFGCDGCHVVRVVK